LSQTNESVLQLRQRGKVLTRETGGYYVPTEYFFPAQCQESKKRKEKTTKKYFEKQ
jgi:hypothetical protein